MESKHAHLHLIQAVINRLSNNSFLLKGWTVVLVSGLFALAAANAKAFFIYLAYFPAIAFWILDGYFLLQERLFRALYDEVRQLPDAKVDFAMDTAIVANRVPRLYCMLFSRTLVIFHGAIIGSILVVMFIFVIGGN